MPAVKMPVPSAVPLVDGVLHLTNSEMTAWRTCRRDWYLRYYLGFVPRVGPEAGSPLSIGTAYHDALAAYYDQFREENLTADVRMPVEFVAPVYAAAEANEPHRKIELANEQELVTIMLDGYGQWINDDGLDADLRILAAETKVEVPLVKDGAGVVHATLLTKLDARVERISTTERLALEHKTTTNLKQNMFVLQGDSQCLTEHLAEKLALVNSGADGRRADGVLYNMARKVKRTGTAKPPFYGREHVWHSDAELRSHYVHMHSIACSILDARRRLDAGESHHTVCPPTVDKAVAWRTGFLTYYLLMDEGGDWVAALDDHYVQGNPLDRYTGTASLED